MTQVTSAHLGESLGTDFFSVREQFTLYCLQIGRPAEAARLIPTVAGLAKMHNTRKACAITAEARDMLEPSRSCTPSPRRELRKVRSDDKRNAYSRYLP